MSVRIKKSRVQGGRPAAYYFVCIIRKIITASICNTCHRSEEPRPQGQEDYSENNDCMFNGRPDDLTEYNGYKSFTRG